MYNFVTKEMKYFSEIYQKGLINLYLEDVEKEETNTINGNICIMSAWFSWIWLYRGVGEEGWEKRK